MQADVLVKLAKMSTSDLKKLCSTMNVNHIGQGWGPIVALLKRRLQRHRYFHLHSLCYNHHPLQRVLRWPRLQHRHRHRRHHRLQRVLLLLQLPLWRLLLQRGSNSASAATAASFNGFLLLLLLLPRRWHSWRSPSNGRSLS